MSTSEKQIAGVRQAAWGCLVLYADLNFNGINLLPNFAAYFLMLLAIGNLKEEDRDFALLQPLAVLLTGWHLAQWLLGLLGIPTEGRLHVLQPFAAVINLYFCFQFYTDLAKMARRAQAPDGSLEQRILRSRTVLTVFVTVLSLPLPWNPDAEWQKIVLAVLTLIGVLAGIVQMVNLFALSRLLRTESGPEEA